MITSDDVKAILNATGMTQGQLAERAGVSQPTVSRWLKGATPDPAQAESLNRIINEISHGAFDPRSERQKAFSIPFKEAFDAPEIDKGQFPRDVPMRGIATCGDDASFILNGQTGDYARRPPGLAGRRSVYALNVYGDSMYPVYRHNALVYVDPNQTPSVTEDAVIELHPRDPNDNEPGKGFLKRVKALKGGKIVCEQFNPPEEVIFDRADVKSFHRVVPWEEVLGY